MEAKSPPVSISPLPRVVYRSAAAELVACSSSVIKARTRQPRCNAWTLSHHWLSLSWPQWDFARLIIDSLVVLVVRGASVHEKSGPSRQSEIVFLYCRTRTSTDILNEMQTRLSQPGHIGKADMADVKFHYAVDSIEEDRVQYPSHTWSNGPAWQLEPNGDATSIDYASSRPESMMKQALPTCPQSRMERYLATLKACLPRTKWTIAFVALVSVQAVFCTTIAAVVISQSLRVVALTRDDDLVALFTVQLHAY